VWKPPERVRHDPLPGGWPTRAEAAGARLFAPLSSGRLELATRTWVPAMVPWRATEEGEVTDALLAWYERLARGRPGALVVEATGIRDIPSGPLLRIGDDRFLPGLRRLVDTVRRASDGETKLFLQVIDFLRIRRRPEPGKFFARFLELRSGHLESLRALGVDPAPDATWPPTEDDERAVRSALAGLDDDRWPEVLSERELEALRRGERDRVTDLHLPRIEELPRVLPGLFAAAAERAERAGFHGVELHYAHAYTMASFLSRRNDRDDGYGGSLENRLRLPLEVHRAVRDAVGDRFVVGCRYLADEIIEGGNALEETIPIGVALAKAGMDFLSLSRGGKFEDALEPRVGQAIYPYTGRSGWECMPGFLADERGPFGRNVEPARAIRSAVRAAGHETPVVAIGGIHTFTQAEEILDSGAADVVGAARQSLADPDWYLKMREGRGASIRQCTYTNYCESLDRQHKKVTCRLWDKEDVEGAGELVSSDGKRRLVAPG